MAQIISLAQREGMYIPRGQEDSRRPGTDVLSTFVALLAMSPE